MGLTKEEKYKIYLQEKERLANEEQQIETAKLQTLTDEDRLKIFNEIESKNTVFVNKEALIIPGKNTAFNIGAFVVGASFFVHIGLGLILLAVFVIYHGARIVTGNPVILSPMISFKCPKCDHLHKNFIRKDEFIEHKNTGKLRAGCLNCKDKFQLVIEESVLNSTQKKS